MKNQFEIMTLTPVERLIPRLAAPSMLSMITGAVYNTADTWFVSRLGDSATGATGVCLAVTAMLQAVGFWIGMGAASNISRFLGRKHTFKACITASSAIVMAMLGGLMLTIFGILFNRPLLSVLGSTPTILPYAQQYSNVLFLGAPFACSSFVLNNLLRSQGRALFSMIGVVSGAILNIFLDPIFIFVFDFGIAGAALSTIICQTLSFSIMFIFICSQRSLVRVKLRYVSKNVGVYLMILSTGLPSLIRQGCNAAATVLLNRAAGSYGDAAVAAMSVVGRINFLVGSLVGGFGQGFQPVAGFAYGGKNYSRVKQSYKFSIIVCFSILTVGALICSLFASQIVGSFKSDSAAVVEIGVRALRYQCFGMPFFAFVILANMLLQTTGQKFMASFTSLSRQGFFFIPLIIILPHFYGLMGVEICQPLADVFSAVLCIGATVYFFRNKCVDIYNKQN